jgi:hypothetical protein
MKNLDDIILEVLETKRPLGWSNGPSDLALVRDKAVESGVTFKSLDEIDNHIKELAKEGWVYWDKSRQRWEINNGPPPSLAKRVAFTFTLTPQQIEIYENWAKYHRESCPAKSGWVISFTLKRKRVTVTCPSCNNMEVLSD